MQNSPLKIYLAGYIEFQNEGKELVPECMEWQDLPELHHPTVKLGGELDLFWPSWKTAYTLPNHATKEQIVAITSKPKN